MMEVKEVKKEVEKTFSPITIEITFEKKDEVISFCNVIGATTVSWDFEGSPMLPEFQPVRYLLMDIVKRNND